MKIKDLNPKIKMSTQERQKNIKMKNAPLQKDSKFSDVPKEYMEVAQGMETQFAHRLIQEMRKSVHKSRPESNAEKYYQSLLDYEHAEKIAKHQGIGLKEVILDQIYPQKNRKINKMKAASEAYQHNTPTAKELGHERN